MNQEIYTRIIEDHKELSSLPQTLSEVLRGTKGDGAAA